MNKMKSLKECYYCKNKFEVGKLAIGDHVIPDALGGKIAFSNVCTSCNIQLNDNLDIHLINLYKMQAMMLGIRPQKNKLGKSSVVFNKFNVLGRNENLKAELINNDVRLKEQLIINDEGKKIFIAPNQRIMDKKNKSKKKLPFDEVFIPNNNFGVGVSTCKIDDNIILRAVSKICVNFIGYEKGIEYLKSVNLEELKNFITTGNNPINKFKRICIGNKDEKHLKKYHNGIVIKKEESKLIGLISIFGDLQKVMLSDKCDDDFEQIDYFDRYY